MNVIKHALATAAIALMAPVCAVADTPAVTSGACASTVGADGGDWPQSGGDLLQSNDQNAEKKIGPGNVVNLVPQWVIPNTGAQSVPAIAGRCVYAVVDAHVTAYDLATGAQVFRSPTELPVQQYQPFGVAVANDRVHVHYDNMLTPRAAAFDANTGAPLWTSEPISFGYQAWQLQNAIVFDGLELFHTTGPDFDIKARPGYAIFDATTGATLHKQTTIPVRDLDKGYAGGGVWGNDAIDPVTKYAFVGTANPYSRKFEHRYDNAIIKIDLDRTRPTFGQIVDAYKGQTDNVVDGVYNQPVCETMGDSGPGYVNPPCGQMDVDFGNGPAMWRTPDGDLMLAQIQKTGMLHVLYADHMQRAWTLQLGTNSVLTLTGGNHGYIATDGKTLFVPANPGTLWALDAATGAIKWTAAMPGNRVNDQNLVVANGVLYGLDGVGVRAWDAETGTPLWQYVGQTATGGAWTCSGDSGGLSLARHTLIVNCSGTIAAFRLAS